MNRFGLSIALCAALTAGVFTGCSGATNSASAASAGSVSSSAPSAMVASSNGASAASGAASTTTTASLSGTATSTASASTASASGAILSTSDMFTDRDLEQEADTSSAQSITLENGKGVSITEEGVYVVSGTAENCTITVAADDSAKVQLVLDNASITNESAPAIYVKSADKVFVTTASGTTNTLSTTGTFAAIGDDNVDGVIYSKDDLVLNGKGTLTVKSSGNGIVGKDDVKVTGGTYAIEAADHGIQGKDSVAIADGTFAITATTDAIHSKNADDQTLGYLYIAGGTFDLKAGSDGLVGTSAVQIDGGTFTIDAAEGIEGTYVQINDGTVSIQASDDGINATSKSTAYDVTLEINGGKTTVSMGSGDTDALDSNGNLYINGGTVDITAQSAFDYDGQGALNGGTVTVNGEQITEMTNSMMGRGGGHGGMGGPQGDSSGSRGGWR